MKNFKRIFLLVFALFILIQGKNVFAYEKYTLEDFVFFDPISEKTCNVNNYWTFYNQDTTCYRFIILNKNDTTSNGTIKLLLDHNVGYDVYDNYSSILNSQTSSWTRQNGSVNIPDEDTIADVMGLGSVRPTPDSDNISKNGGTPIYTLSTNTEQYINGTSNKESGYWVSGTVPGDDSYAYSITQYGNNRLVSKTAKRGIRPMITVDKSLLTKLPVVDFTSNLQNATEYKYSYPTEKYGDHIYKQLQGFTVTDTNVVFHMSNSGNPDYGLLIGYKGSNYSTQSKLSYDSTGHGNDLTYISDENKVLLVGPNSYKTIYQYDGSSLNKTKEIELSSGLTAIGYDDYNKKILGLSTRRILVHTKNFEALYSMDLPHLITGQGLEYNDGYVYATCFDYGQSSEYQMYHFNEAFSGKVYVIDARLKSDGTPDTDFGKLVKVLYIGNVKRNGLDGTGELETVSFHNNKMWFGYAAQYYDDTNVVKLYTIDDSKAAVAPQVSVSYKVEDNYTKVTLTSRNQLHTLSGWTQSTDKKTLSKNYYDATAAHTVNVCDNYSNCVNKNIKELTIKKPTVSFSNLNVTKPFSAGTYTLKASTNGDGEIEYKSSNENVATVDANGKVTFKKLGRVDISAVTKKTDNYYQAAAYYTLLITKDDQSLEFANTQINKSYGDDSFTITATHSVGDGEVTYDSSNTNVASVDNGGKVTINGTGTTTITATAAETDSYNIKTTSYSLNVVPRAQELSFDKSSVSKKFGENDFTIEVNLISGDGEITYTSSNKEVATVTNSGKVTIKGVGTTIITATAASTSNYDASSASYSLNISKGEQIIKTEEKIKDNITKNTKDSKFSIKAGLDIGDGKITYSSSNEKVATVDEEGSVTIVGPGDTVLSINVSGTDNYESTVKSILLRVDNIEDKDVLEDIPNTAKGIPFETIRNVLSFFLILLGVTYIIRKKPIFEK